MSTDRNEEEKRRHRGYESAEDSYTDRRYGHAAMQLYSRIRADEIHNILAKEFIGDSTIALLDVGCGTGILLSELTKQRPEMQLYGIDFSQKMLYEARTRLTSNGTTAKLVKASAFELPFPSNSFDVIVSTRFIHQYSDELKLKILNEMRRCIKPSGLAIVEFYSFVPWLIRYLLMWWRTNAGEHFKHCTMQRTLKRFIGSDTTTVPLMIPGSTRLSIVVGIFGVRWLRTLLKDLGWNFLFDQYLAVFGKE